MQTTMQVDEIARAHRLERAPSVRARTGLSRAEMHRRVRAGRFPKPIRIGKRAVAFDSREVDAWIEQVIATGRAPGVAA